MALKLLLLRQKFFRIQHTITSMETDLGIESLDFVNHNLFLVYFSDGTHLTVTAGELKKRFADLVQETSRPDDEWNSM